MIQLAPTAESGLFEWVGRTEQRRDVIERARSTALLAALGRTQDTAGDDLPLLHHWLYFWDVRPPAELGPDGHPARGGFMPPVALPRRMWAGSRVTFHRPIKLGQCLARTSDIRRIEEKSGRSGPLTFVTVSHELRANEGVVLAEEQDIVYRDQAAPLAPRPIGQPTERAMAAAWTEAVLPDSVLLFRYSALTLNGHRIHYDAAYAGDIEGYPGLVVHGPLQATLMIDMAQRLGGRPIAAFEFRGLAPAFCDRLLRICGEPDKEGADLWVEQDGHPTMSGRVTWKTKA